MAEEKTQNKENLLDNQVPRKIFGLLLKKNMSSTDLAEKIYGKKNVRSGISKWIGALKQAGWIERTDMGIVTKRKQLYRAKLEALGDFDNKERKFIQICIKRFWNPLTSDLNKSLTDLLLEALVIKKICKLKRRVNHYKPNSDLEKYKKNKDRFWDDDQFRDNFLDEILKKGEKRFNKPNFKGHYLKKDFVFFSLLIPESLFYKLLGEHRSVGSPINLTISLLDEKG